MSSLDHHKQNAKRGSSALAHTGVTHANLYPTRPVRHSHGETLNYPVSSQVVLHKTTQHTIFQSTTATDGQLSSGGFVDVRIPAGSLQVVKGMTLQLELENEGGVAVTIGGGVRNVFLFDRIELVAEGGNTQIARWEPTQLVWPFRHVNGSSWDKNWTNAFGPTQIAAGAVGIILAPILNEVFSRNEAYLGHLRSDMYLRVWFKGASAFDWGFAGPPKLRSLSAIIEQDGYAPEDRWRLHEQRLSQSVDYRFGRPGFQSVVENLGPNQRYTVMLTAVQGLVTEMVVTIRAAGATANQAWNFKPWASYELLDSSGASLLGGMPITKAYQNYVIEAERQVSGAIDNLSTASLPIVIEFGDARADFQHGSLTGYICFTGNERLVITTDSSYSATPTPYEIRVEYLAAARVNVDRGRVSVFPS